MENWLDKYKPNKLSEVLGDRTQIQKINSFIKQFTKKKINIDSIPNPNMIISGSNGIGKTLITDLVLQENGFEKVVADLSNISVARRGRTRKTDKELTGQNRSVNTYYMVLSNNKKLLSTGEFSKKKIALVFDDVSNISNPKEKEAIKAMIKTNNKYKEFPIIIIANTKHNKTVNDIRKLVTYVVRKTDADGKKDNYKVINEVSLRSPDYCELERFIKKICTNEKFTLVKKKTDEDDICLTMVEHAQHDVRRLINVLEELKMIYENKVTYEDFIKYCETSKKKDLDPGIYEATKMLLNDYTNIDSALTLYGEERATIPLMVHENYPLNIRTQYPKMSIENQLKILYNISASISESDKVDGLIYSSQCWNLQPVHGFYSCVLPSFYINQMPNKRCIKENYKYTQDYNKTSIKKINNKVIKKAQENQFLKKMSIHDFLYMASILKVLIERKEFEKVAELMSPYNLKLKEIESIIKIDKIKKPKTTLTGKQKALLKELLGVTE